MFKQGEILENEEIIFTGNYKDFKSDRHYYTKNANNRDVAAILVQLSDFIEPFVYKFSGIDVKKIDELIPLLDGISDVILFLKSFKHNSLLPAAQNKITMLPIAESYLVNQLLKKAGIAFKPIVTTSIKPETENPEDQVVFVGNCKGWFAVKKMTINEKTEDWEVAGILSGINFTLVNKAFDFAEINGSQAPKSRKSFSALADALSKININNAYAVCKTCENIGYKPYATPEILVNEYPNIKPPKVKGRKPKG